MTKILFPVSLALVALLHAQTAPNGSSNKAPGAATSRAAQRSYEISDLLDATNEARTAVEAQNQQDALFHINHALEKADKTQSLSPNMRIVQLYDELDRYSVLGPLMSQRQQQQSNTNSPNTTTTNAGHTTVREVEGHYTSVGLDIQAAKDHLTAAKQAITQNEWQKADAALAAVQNGVVVTTVAADMPLLRARENMILARRAAEDGHYGETHAALTSSSNALKEYENNHGPHAAEARTLQSQMDTYNQSVQQNHADAVSKIDSWWDQMTGWTATSSNHKG